MTKIKPQNFPTPTTKKAVMGKKSKKARKGRQENGRPVPQQVEYGFFTSTKNGRDSVVIEGFTQAKADLDRKIDEIGTSIDSLSHPEASEDAAVTKAALKARLDKLKQFRKLIKMLGKKSAVIKTLDVSECAWCHKGAGEVTTSKKSLQWCGWCHDVSYCSAKCQKKHWKAGKHKYNCPGVPNPSWTMVIAEPDKVALAMEALGGRANLKPVDARDYENYRECWMQAAEREGVDKVDFFHREARTFEEIEQKVFPEKQGQAK